MLGCLLAQRFQFSLKTQNLGRFVLWSMLLALLEVEQADSTQILMLLELAIDQVPAQATALRLSSAAGCCMEAL